MTETKNTYSQKYYAMYDTAAKQPTPITGWIDISLFTTIPDWLPNEASLIALTDDEWSTRQSTGQGISAGKVVSYTPPIPVISLVTQASAALASARTYVYNNYGILNEDTPSDWVTYIKALMAISNGTDTTSTILPIQPAD